MSRVEALKTSRDSQSVKFLEFTRVASKGKVAVFFEGEDEKYYSVRLNNICPSVIWAGINCKGKSNVVDIRNRIRLNETYKNYLCIFFVDSDFDDNSTLSDLPDIYTTPCYSVENLYVSDSAFARVLSSEFGVSETSDEHKCFEACMSKYRDIKSQYINAISGFNFLIREIRLMERTGGLVGRLNINNVSIDDLISIDLSGITKVYSESLPNSIFPELAEDQAINLENSKEYFRDKSGEFWYRGKQNLDFFRLFLSKLKNDRGRKEDREVFKNKGSVKLQLTKSNAISELSQYAETPECLREFLESFEVQSRAA